MATFSGFTGGEQGFFVFMTLLSLALFFVNPIVGILVGLLTWGMYSWLCV